MKKSLKAFVFGVILFTTLILPVPIMAQYTPLNIVEPDYVTISSTEGINVNSITANYDGSYSISLGNSNRSNRGEITSYNFEWYLSYKGKRVSDYFQETIRCGQSSSRKVYCWPGEVPSGNERYVTVQLGREPIKRDRRDDD